MRCIALVAALSVSSLGGCEGCNRSQLASGVGQPVQAPEGSYEDFRRVVDDSAEFELRPPSADQVLNRARVLLVISRRSMLEGDEDPTGADTERKRGIAWLKTMGAWEVAEVEERRLLNAPIGSFSDMDRLNTSWRFEGATVLCWALGLIELPAHDIVTPADLPTALGYLDDEAAIVPTLVPAQDIAAFEKVQTLVHWRFRQYMHVEQKHIDFAALGADCWLGSVDLSAVPMQDGDLRVVDSPIHGASDEKFHFSNSIALERHIASRWLIGSDSIYSEVDTST